MPFIPYTKSAQICLCPSDAIGKGDSYAMNGRFRIAPDVSSCFSGTSLSPGISLAAVRESAATIFLMEESTGAHNSTDDGVVFPDVNPGSIRHFDGSNYGFADGHAKFYKSTQIKFPNADGTPRFEP